MVFQSLYLFRRFERSHSIRRIPVISSLFKNYTSSSFLVFERSNTFERRNSKKGYIRHNWFVGDEIPTILKFVLRKDGFDGTKYRFCFFPFFFMKLNQPSLWNNKHEWSFDCALKSWINCWSMDLQIARDVINKGKHCVTIPFVRKNNDARSI